MATPKLFFDIVANDKTQRAFKSLARELESTEARTKRIGNALKFGMAAAAASATAAVAGLSLAIRGAINEADAMAKSAQKFGVSVEELSRLKHAADLSGISLEGLGTGLRKLSQSMADTAAGTGESKDAFERLGISVTNADGTLKSSTQVMTEVADRFSRMKDGADKTAISMDIFGRSGTELIPMLNAGRDGLQEMLDEADRLGITLGTDTAKAAEVLNDNLTRMQRIFDGVVLSLTADMLPELANLSSRLLDLDGDSDLAGRAAKALGEMFEWVALLAVDAAGGIQQVTAETRGLVEAVALLGQADFAGALGRFQQGVAEGRAAFEEAERRKRIIRGEGGSHNPGTHPAERDSPTTPPAPSAPRTPYVPPPPRVRGGGGGGGGKPKISDEEREAERAAKSFATLAERMREKIALTREEMVLLPLEGAARERVALQLDAQKLRTDALAESMKAKGKVSEDELAQINALIDQHVALGQARVMDADALERQRDAAEQHRSEMEAIADEITGPLKNALSAGEASFKSFADAFLQIGQNMTGRLLDTVFKPIEDALFNMLSSSGGGGILGSILGALGLGGGGLKIGGAVPAMPGPAFTTPSFLPKLANGGPAHGWAIVGERGPELAHFGSPARVFSNAESRKMMGGGGVSLTMNVDARGSTLTAGEFRSIARQESQRAVGALISARKDDPGILA